MINTKSHSKVIGRVLPLLVLFAAAAFSPFVSVMSEARQDASPVRIGERLTYTISFNKYDGAGYAEIRVVSKGEIEGQQAIELYTKLKSSGLLSATFFMWDDERTTYISPDNGLPLFIRDTSRTTISPRVSVRDYLKERSASFDLLSLVYKARQSGGSGSFTVLEGGNQSQFDFTVTGGERIVTEAGDFATTVSSVQSPYLSELGITDMRINFSSDERMIPVKVRFRTTKGDFVAQLASIQDLSPKPDPTAAATPVPTVTPVRTPTPEPTPRPYVRNRPLSPDLPFRLGEKLEYRVTKRGAPVADVVLEAAERNLFTEKDALRLSAKVVSLGSANDIFASGDIFETWVEPDTLAPFSTNSRYSGFFSKFSQTAIFDQTVGSVIVNAGAPLQIPVGTHNLLSLAYAVRAFNLRGSAVPSDPVNDTRVAVFVSGEPVILTLRPGAREAIEISGRKRQAQVIAVRAETPIDRLNIRLWLSADAARIPLRLVVGDYQADLTGIKSEPPR